MAMQLSGDSSHAREVRWPCSYLVTVLILGKLDGHQLSGDSSHTREVRWPGIHLVTVLILGKLDGHAVIW